MKVVRDILLTILSLGLMGLAVIVGAFVLLFA